MFLGFHPFPRTSTLISSSSCPLGCFQHWKKNGERLGFVIRGVSWWFEGFCFCLNDGTFTVYFLWFISAWWSGFTSPYDPLPCHRTLLWLHRFVNIISERTKSFFARRKEEAGMAERSPAVWLLRPVQPPLRDAEERAEALLHGLQSCHLQALRRRRPWTPSPSPHPQVQVRQRGSRPGHAQLLQLLWN